MGDRRWNKNSMLAFIDSHIIDYPTPTNLSYFWSFGSVAGICLVIQILTGIFLAMHYTPHVDLAFSSVEHIMRDVNNGWLIRYLHANGASMFFIVVYAHIFRGLYYGSYMSPREHLWCSGVGIFILMMATAFMGYVLHWGQMSFWGATVITNLFSAIPLVGDSIVQWLWGGFSVDNATLNRFFSLHYLMPFAIAGLTIVHLSLLHKDGSNNPIGVDSAIDRIPFYPYFYVKDLFSLLLFITFFSVFVFFYPNDMGHPDNYIPANPMVTPPHIVPEWYFLPFYAILRSIPDKLGGVVAMGGALVILLLLPFINFSEIRSALFRPFFKIGYWFFVANFLILGWIGQNVVETPFIEIGQVSTFFYFFFVLVYIPALGLLERVLTASK
jgi:ubiquinol-cytochrome c reductase cytochrome b subunit